MLKLTELVAAGKVLQGVSVCGETTLVVSNLEQYYEWKDYGLKIHISEDSLPTSMAQCNISIKASLAGHYEFKDGTHLVSAIFWLYCEPPCRFQKPVCLEMQHCARCENVSQLSFVRAVCNQVELPYNFIPVHSGLFSTSSSYGILKLSSFSGIGITRNGGATRYIANVLYKKIENCTNCFYLYFVIHGDTGVHYNAVSLTVNNDY